MTRSDLTRAMTDVDGYICCSPEKRSVLDRLSRDMRSFDTTHQRSRSYLLNAPPGSGKTFLINQLAKSIPLRLVKFNITLMPSRADLIDCFDTISTTQAQSSDQVVLAFFAEINASIAGQPVFDAFLAPLEDGVYVRAGKTFHIAPCIWVFVGTGKPPRGRKNTHDQALKYSDFLSRLSMELSLEPPQRGFAELSRLEKVYTGTYLLRREFQDVLHISDRVLNGVRLLPADTRMRRLTHFVKSFVGVQNQRVLAENMPPTWMNDFQIPAAAQKRWRNRPDETLVRIIG